MTKSITPITAENVAVISQRLKLKGGFIIKVWAALNWRYTVTLYKQPSLTLKRKVTIGSRHQGGNPSNPHDDRQYRFGKSRDKKGLRLLFPSLSIGVYNLAIAPQWGGLSWVDFIHGKYLYVPSKEHLTEAFTHVFSVMTAPHVPSLTPAGIDTMITYILDDLETKKELRKIIVAGMQADAVCGFV